MIERTAIALLLAAGLIGGSYVTGRIHGGNKVRDAWDADKARATAAALVAEQDARRIEQERAKAAKELTDAARRQVAKARADAASAAAAADSLRDAARAAAASCAASNPASASGSPADGLADVLDSMEREGRRMAEEADRAVIAGQACERAYTSLTQ